MTLYDAKPISFRFPVLVADVGGTNCRFAIVSDSNAQAIRFETARTANYPDMSAAISDCVLKNTSLLPRTAILAVAGPVTGDKVPLTNAQWVIEPLKMIEDLGLEEVIVLNDFEAQALALPSLDDKDVKQVGGGTIKPFHTKFVLGPGTGLGAAPMVYAASTWIPVPSEGGHMELGPVTLEDYRIWQELDRHGQRISAEHVISGTGLPRLAHAVATVEGATRSFEKAADVTGAADAGDEIALKVMKVYARAIGRFAGDCGLSVLARGGVYIAGGVTKHVAKYLQDGSFREAFETKTPHEKLMQSIPTLIVTHPNPALEGLAAFARARSLFAVEVNERRWTAPRVRSMASARR